MLEIQFLWYCLFTRFPRWASLLGRQSSDVHGQVSGLHLYQTHLVHFWGRGSDARSINSIQFLIEKVTAELAGFLCSSKKYSNHLDHAWTRHQPYPPTNCDSEGPPKQGQAGTHASIPLISKKRWRPDPLSYFMVFESFWARRCRLLWVKKHQCVRFENRISWFTTRWTNSGSGTSHSGSFTDLKISILWAADAREELKSACHVNAEEAGASVKADEERIKVCPEFADQMLMLENVEITSQIHRLQNCVKHLNQC